MKHYKIIAMTAMENEQRVQYVLNNPQFNYIATVSPDENGVKKIINTAIDALVVMTDNLTGDHCALLEQIYMAKKNIVMILITNVCDLQMLTEAMDCGIGKVLTTDMDKKEIQENIVAEIVKNQSRGSKSEEKGYDSKILSVFGTKGGTGKTTVAVNMAVALQKKGKKVLLIDLDLQFGDVGVFMDVPVHDTISDLIEENDFSLATIKNYIYKHSSGVRLLLAPQSPEFAELVKSSHINEIVTAVKEFYDYIIFDLGPTLDECALQALEMSDTVYFIVTPEISTLKNTKTCMKVMTTLELAGKVKFILNKDGDSYVKKKDVESTLDNEIAFVIPSEPKNTIASINRGVPIVISYPKSKVSKEIVKYVNGNEI